MSTLMRSRPGNFPFAVALTAACLCIPASAPHAQPASPQWSKLCEELPDTNCATWIQLKTGKLDEMVGVQIIEPKGESPSKFLRVYAFFAEAPASQSGAFQIALDSKPFAELPFVQCQDKSCIGQRPITAEEIALLESTKTIRVQSGVLTVDVPAGDLAAARASRGVSVAESKEAYERRLENAKKQGAAISKKLAEDTATPPRDPDKENCGSILLPDNEAIAACDRAIASGKYKGRDLADLFHTRGLKFGTMGQAERGTADFNAAIRADPTFAPAYAERGSDYLHAQKYDLAIRDFNEALRLDSSDTSTLFSRGLAYRSLGQRDRAIADFRRVYQLNPRIEVARKVLREIGVEP